MWERDGSQWRQPGRGAEFTPDTGDILKLDGKTFLRRISKSGGVSMGADDALIIGCGEARQTMEDNVSVVSELVHIESDGAMHFYVNLQSGWGARKVFTLNTDGSLVVPNAEKTRQLLDVPKIGDGYLKSEVYSKTEVYNRSQVDEKIPITGYTLLTFGTITKNSRYVQNNPFGKTPCIVIAQILLPHGIWTETSFIYSTAGLGVKASAYEDQIVVQTGKNALMVQSVNDGNPSGTNSNHYSAPCRVIVWRLGI